MNSFKEAMEHAAERAAVKHNKDEAAMLLARNLYRRQAEANKAHMEIARRITSALVEKAEDQGLLAVDATERSVHRYFAANEGRRSEVASGWILAERIGKLSFGTVSAEDNYPYVPLTGLLLDTESRLQAYRARLSPSYPKVSATDAWGIANTDMHAPNLRDNPIYGDYETLNESRIQPAEVNEFETKVRSVGGMLSLEDMLAGLAVRHGLDVA